MDKITFGSVIRNQRKKTGLNQRELSYKLMISKDNHISAAYLCDLEIGKRPGTSNDYLIKQISKVLNINYYYLYYLQDKWPPKKENLDEAMFLKAFNSFKKDSSHC